MPGGYVFILSVINSFRLNVNDLSSLMCGDTQICEILFDVACSRMSFVEIWDFSKLSCRSSVHVQKETVLLDD